jgi:pyruvate/2-oxoglutarate dehydrogenase complex dihydrolipoamide dehydrogenase (E3) component
MVKNEFDILVIGTGSAGFSVGLLMNEAGFKVLMIDKSDDHIGGECLKDVCVRMEKKEKEQN